MNTTTPVTLRWTLTWGVMTDNEEEDPGLMATCDQEGRWVEYTDYAALREQLATARRDVWDGLKVTNDQLSWALKELGPTGTNAEAYIKATVEYVMWCRAQLKEMR